MTVSQLYGLYCAGHAQAWNALLEVRSSDELVVHAAGLTGLERLILELALLDVTNGTPLRTIRSFERALRHGADVLRPLGVIFDDSRLGVAAAEVDEAA